MSDLPARAESMTAKELNELDFMPGKNEIDWSSKEWAKKAGTRGMKAGLYKAMKKKGEKYDE